jgi:hypothetical protein
MCHLIRGKITVRFAGPRSFDRRAGRSDALPAENAKRATLRSPSVVGSRW